MKKIITTTLVLFLCLTFSGCFKKQNESQNLNQNQLESNSKNLEKTDQELESSPSQNAENQTSAPIREWIPYVNQKFGYQIEYPYNWYFLKDACCPPPPALVVFNNYSDTQEEFTAKQMEPDVHSISILCNYEGVIDNIGEVKLYKEEGVSNKTKKVNGFDSIIFTKDRTPGDSSIQVKTYYIVDGTQGCRITYDTDCPKCQQITESFKFMK